MGEKLIPKELKKVVEKMILNYEYTEMIQQYTGVSSDTIGRIRKEIKPPKKRKDSIFKTIFRNKKMFLMFVQSFVKQKWVQEITEDDLEYHPSLFPEIIESDRESDVVYKITKDSEEIYVFIMLENQSTVDFLMPFRLLEYMCRLWRRHVQDNKQQARNKQFKLPAILPILFFDGDEKQGWTAETKFLNKVEDKNLFKDYTPKFEYVLIDLTKIPFRELERLKNPSSLIMLLDKLRTSEDLKYIKELTEDFWEPVRKIVIENELTELISQVIYLLLKKNHADDHIIRRTIDSMKKG